MKTMNFQSLMLVVVMILGLASCTGDNFDNPAPQNALGEKIVGLWYNKTDTEGVLPDGMNWNLGNGVDQVKYNRIIRSLLLRADGTGYACAMWFNNEQSEPIYMMGGLDAQGLSPLTYTTTADGRIILSFDQDNTSDVCAEYFGQWSLSYADGTVSCSDGEATFQMELADDTMTGWLNGMYHRAAGGADADDDSENINAKDFTPENWRNQGAIYIYDGVGAITDANGLPGYTKVNMPWRNSVTNLPDGFCDNITPENGWEWVYNLCGSRTTTNLNYFFLYNKYTGTLRVFYYMPKMTQVGNDHAWKVSLGNEIALHSLWGYALPSTATIKDRSAIAQTATNVMIDYVSPWCELPDNSDGQIIPREGWWAFDIDLSLYRPDTDLSKQNIKLEMLSWTLQHISLYSTMSANIDGSIKQAIKDSGSKSKSSSIAKGILSGLQAGLNFASGIAGFATGNPAAGFSGLAGAVGCGNSIAGLGGGAAAQPFEAEVSLGMSGTINTEGFIQNNEVTMGVPSYTISLTSFDRKHCPSFAEGVWNIKSHPIVYQFTDLIVLNTLSNSTSAGAPIYFFDPSSIEVQLNPNVFPESEVEWMQVDATCIATPQNEMTGTDKYRDAFELSRRHTVIGIDGNLHLRVGDDLAEYGAFTEEFAPFYDFMCFSSQRDNSYFSNLKYPLDVWSRNDGKLKIAGCCYRSSFDARPSYGIEPVCLSEWGENAIPGLEVNVIVHVKLKGMDQPLAYSRNYLPDVKRVEILQFEGICEQIKSHQLSPKQEGHHASYDYQVERIGKMCEQMDKNGWFEWVRTHWK